MTTIPNQTSPGINTGAARVGSAGLFLVLLLVATWSLTHHYQGLSLDGELYALQAAARLNPALHADVYLAATSQDEYTVFSPLYAWTIRFLGLRAAGATLFALCTVAFITGGWAIARSLWTQRLAWLAAAALIVTVCPYGAYGVFHYSEDYLTARSLAEVLVVLAIAARFYGLATLSWLIAAFGMLIHPLMALPGLLLLLCLSVSWRLRLLGAAAGTLLALALALVSAMAMPATGPLAIVQGAWLDMVNERSQFLFLQNWHWTDWQSHARIALCLSTAALCAQDSRVRSLCGAAALVGCTGLLVGYIAGSVGPAAVLLQGQAWRWFWVCGFISVLTLMPTFVWLWNQGGYAMCCAVLLLASWTLPHPYGTLSAAMALSLWVLRDRLPPRHQAAMAKTAFGLIAALLFWTAVNIWNIGAARNEQRYDAPLLARFQDKNVLQIPALGLVGLGLLWVRSERFCYLGSAAAAALLALSAYTLPAALRQSGSTGSEAEADSFARWREAIPATSSVLMLPSRNSAGFVWFSLRRPSYLSVNQSAGVVFSEETAAEIRRRSDVLLPVMDPDWHIMSNISGSRRGEKAPDPNRPLTSERLSAICTDPRLGFVMAREQLVAYTPLRQDVGEWKDWNLYDCSRVRAAAAPV